MQIAIGLLLTVALATPIAVNGAESGAVSTTAGVKVGKMSGLRLLVSAEQVETQAGHHYAGLKQAALSKRTLAPDSDPQVLRLRGIAAC